MGFQVYVGGYAMTFTGYLDPAHKSIGIIEKSEVARIRSMDIWEMKAIWERN
jgi:hypothetical protein